MTRAIVASIAFASVGCAADKMMPAPEPVAAVTISPSTDTLAPGAALQLAAMEKATGQKDVLLSRGMPPTLLDDLTGALGGLEKTIESTRAGRRDHVGASADLQTVAAEIKKQVRALDGMVRYRFGDNAELMGAWRSARNVLGPFKTKNEPEAGGSQTPKAA